MNLIMAKDNYPATVSEETVIHKIHFIRGQKVMLDSDLAELYGVETKRLKEQVKRNIERFPEHYMFELTAKENEILKNSLLLKHNILSSCSS